MRGSIVIPGVEGVTLGGQTPNHCREKGPADRGNAASQCFRQHRDGFDHWRNTL